MSYKFLPKIIQQKNFISKFQFSAKVIMVPPGGQTVTKEFYLWSTQKYSKVSKICLTCVSIFLEFRVCSSQQFNNSTYDSAPNNFFFSFFNYEKDCTIEKNLMQPEAFY